MLLGPVRHPDPALDAPSRESPPPLPTVNRQLSTDYWDTSSSALVNVQVRVMLSTSVSRRMSGGNAA